MDPPGSNNLPIALQVPAENTWDPGKPSQPSRWQLQRYGFEPGNDVLQQSQYGAVESSTLVTPPRVSGHGGACPQLGTSTPNVAT